MVIMIWKLFLARFIKCNSEEVMKQINASNLQILSSKVGRHFCVVEVQARVWFCESSGLSQNFYQVHPHTFGISGKHPATEVCYQIMQTTER